MQRYRCKNCMKTFNAVTNTPLAGLQHKERWIDYLQCSTLLVGIVEAMKPCLPVQKKETVHLNVR